MAGGLTRLFRQGYSSIDMSYHFADSFSVMSSSPLAPVKKWHSISADAYAWQMYVNTTFKFYWCSWYDTKLQLTSVTNGRCLRHVTISNNFNTKLVTRVRLLGDTSSCSHANAPLIDKGGFSGGNVLRCKGDGGLFVSGNSCCTCWSRNFGFYTNE